MDAQQQQESEARPFTKCEREGSFSAGIKDIKMIENRFQGDREEAARTMEVKIDFVTQEYETGAIYLDFSDDYVQAGPNKGKRSCDASMETLEDLGLQKSEFANIKKLIGSKLSINGHKNAKGYLNFYISSAMPQTEMSAAAGLAKFNLLFAPQGQPQQQQQAQAVTQQGNMFAQGGGNQQTGNPFLQQGQK